MLWEKCNAGGAFVVLTGEGIKFMNDAEIIKLYFDRDEDAVSETRAAFGGLLKSVARGILRDKRDAEEAVSDACLAAWNSIPPERPRNLSAYLSRLTRNAAIDRARMNSRQKRGSGEAEAAIEELNDLASSADTEDEALERLAFRRVLDSFLTGLPKKKRAVFVKRYWYLLPVKEIAREMLMSESAVKTQLSRMRAELKEMLEKEDIYCE